VETLADRKVGLLPEKLENCWYKEMDFDALVKLHNGKI